MSCDVYGSDILSKIVTNLIKDCQRVKKISDKAWIKIEVIQQLIDAHAQAGFPEVGKDDDKHQL